MLLKSQCDLILISKKRCHYCNPILLFNKADKSEPLSANEEGFQDQNKNTLLAAFFCCKKQFFDELIWALVLSMLH